MMDLIIRERGIHDGRKPNHVAHERSFLNKSHGNTVLSQGHTDPWCIFVQNHHRIFVKPHLPRNSEHDLAFFCNLGYDF